MLFKQSVWCALSDIANVDELEVETVVSKTKNQLRIYD